jgi:hypothetical protein
MTSYQEPLESRYVIELYHDASERWDEFRRSGDAEVLRALAEVLCRGLGRLQEDADFWTALREIAATTSREDRQAVLDQLADFEDFLIHEYGILSEIGSEAFAVRLLGDMTVAIEMVQEWPDERTIQNLQNRLVDLRNIVCEQTEELPLDEGRRGRRPPGGAAWPRQRQDRPSCRTRCRRSAFPGAPSQSDTEAPARTVCRSSSRDRRRDTGQ